MAIDVTFPLLLNSQETQSVTTSILFLLSLVYLSLPTKTMEHPAVPASPGRGPPGPHSVIIQDGHSPSSPPPGGPPPHMNMNHPHNMGMEYAGRPPPPGSYGGPPPGYSPYPGGPPHQPSPYGGGPHGGGYPRGPPPPPNSGYPGGYPPSHHPHHHSPQPPQSSSYPSGYGYHPGHPNARPSYYSGYEGAPPGYPGPGGQPPPPQQVTSASASSARQAASPYRSPHHHPRQDAPPPASSPQKSSPTEKSPSDATLRSPPKLTENLEVERLRAAAAIEISHDEVRPIETDFHFFVKEHMKEHLKLAEEEVRKSCPDVEKLDPYLVNTNLNSRLLKAWEQLKNGARETYMQKEEDDRRRFMEEDEIASRHCATLTARGKSPREGTVKKEERQETDNVKPTTPTTRDDSPKKDKEEVGKVEEQPKKEEDNTVKMEMVETTGVVESTIKQSSTDEDVQESPAKKSRLEGGETSDS